MEIKVLGTGCAKCSALETLTRETVAELNIDATIVKVDDMVDIMSYNIRRTPGLIIDGKVVVAGHLPTAAQMKDILTEEKCC